MTPAPLFSDKPDSSPIVIATDSLKKHSFPKKTVFAVLTIVFVVAAASSGVWYFKTFKKQIPAFNITKSSPTQNRRFSAETEIKKSVQAGFTSSKDQKIMTYVDLAAEEKDLDTKYQNYLKAYQEMLKKYQQTKDDEAKISLLNLRLYLKAFPQFIETDALLPQ